VTTAIDQHARTKTAEILSASRPIAGLEFCARRTISMMRASTFPRRCGWPKNRNVPEGIQRATRHGVTGSLDDRQWLAA